MGIISILKRLRLALALLFISVFVVGQPMIIVIITIPVIIFYFFPKMLGGLIEKNKEKFREYSIKLIIYLGMVIAIILGFSLNNRIAKNRAEVLISNLERYKVKYQHYPDELNEIVPEFMPKIPKAKIALLGADFIYFSVHDRHYLMYIVISPFGRVYYLLEEKKWGFLD